MGYEADIATRRVYRGMWLVMSLLIMGAAGLIVGGVVILAHGHWWALGPLALLGAVVWGTWWLSGAYNDPHPGPGSDLRDRLRIWLHPDVRGSFIAMVAGRILIAGAVIAGFLWAQSFV